MVDEIRVFSVGALATNCYVLVRKGSCIVVDPGASGERIAEELSDLTIKLIVATHGHHDHVGGVAALKRACGAPFAISVADADRAQHALSLSSHAFAYPKLDVEDAPVPDRLLKEGDLIELEDETLKVLEAPGHTEGGIVLLGDSYAFVGDTIFQGSVGRTDLMGGDAATLASTIQRLKAEIPPDTLLLCGHGPHTRMAEELAHNPWFA